LVFLIEIHGLIIYESCHTAELQQKRLSRNPFRRTPPYPLSCPEMAELLKWCGPDLIPLNAVPWGRIGGLN